LRVCREKFQVASTAEAARLFARSSQGKDSPYSDTSDLAPPQPQVEYEGVLERPELPSPAELEGKHGAHSPNQPLTPRQTLLTIALVSFASIIGLLLLVACAEAVRRLVSA
jgi:hypothetical protein